MLKNVKGIDLNAAASRELVAELPVPCHRWASTVNYTPAFGYVTDKVLKLDESTLGYKNFKLVGKADADSFGRPATKWTATALATRTALVVAKADASYTTKVDECDIAKDLGITSSKKIPMRSTRLARLRLPPSSPQPNLFKESAQSDGFYKITLGADNKVSSVDLVEAVRLSLL